MGELFISLGETPKIVGEHLLLRGEKEKNVGELPAEVGEAPFFM
jgi:hypothetical protein